ncbi:MAG: SDR family oxidoreductase [Bacteroidota bacterium]
MQNKTVLITGAAGGLGKALCLQFGGLGARIIGLDVDQSALSGLEVILREANIPSRLIECDIRSEQACRGAIDLGRETFGPIDILINNAGLTHIGLFQQASLESIQQVIDVNFYGAVNCTHHVLKDLIEGKGSIVTISSVAGLAPLMGRTAYSASKFALHGFFESLRTELLDQGVHVLMVCPSTIDTDMRSRTVAGSIDGQAVGKMASPDFVADGILQAVFHKQRRLIIGPQSRLTYLVHKWMPRLYDRLMIRKVSPQLLSIQKKKEFIPM